MSISGTACLIQLLMLVLLTQLNSTSFNGHRCKHLFVRIYMTLYNVNALQARAAQAVKFDFTTDPTGTGNRLEEIIK